MTTTDEDDKERLKRLENDARSTAKRLGCTFRRLRRGPALRRDTPGHYHVARPDGAVLVEAGSLDEANNAVHSLWRWQRVYDLIVRLHDERRWLLDDGATAAQVAAFEAAALDVIASDEALEDAWNAAFVAGVELPDDDTPRQAAWLRALEVSGESARR